MPQRAAEIELLLPSSFVLSLREDCHDFKNKARVAPKARCAAATVVFFRAKPLPGGICYVDPQAGQAASSRHVWKGWSLQLCLCFDQDRTHNSNGVRLLTGQAFVVGLGP